MAQPSIPGTGVGIPRMPYGSDGTAWIALLVDALGHLQADILSSALPTDAATQTTLAGIQALIGALTNPDAGTVNKQLADAVTALQLIDDLRAALGSVNTDDLQVDVKTSGLPTGAATEATLAHGVEHLTDLSTLIEALYSINLDKLVVCSKSGDKIFGFESIVEGNVSNLNLSAGSNVLSGTAVPTGKVWKLTLVAIYYVGTVPTSITIYGIGLAGNIAILVQKSPVSELNYVWNGEAYLQAGDYVQAYIVGATAGDDLYLHYAGVQMNAP